MVPSHISLLFVVNRAIFFLHEFSTQAACIRISDSKNPQKHLSIDGHIHLILISTVLLLPLTVIRSNLLLVLLVIFFSITTNVFSILLLINKRAFWRCLAHGTYLTSANAFGDILARLASSVNFISQSSPRRWRPNRRPSECQSRRRWSCYLGCRSR